MTEVNDIIKLKLFIEAAEMVGGDNWTPQPEQWRKIREKIMSLPDALGNVTMVNAPQVVHQIPTAPTVPYLPASPPPSPSLFSTEPMTPTVPMTHQPQSSVLATNPESPTKLPVNRDGTVRTDTFS